MNDERKTIQFPEWMQDALYDTYLTEMAEIAQDAHSRSLFDILFNWRGSDIEARAIYETGPENGLKNIEFYDTVSLMELAQHVTIWGKDEMRFIGEIADKFEAASKVVRDHYNSMKDKESA